MQSFKANDGITLKYIDTAPPKSTDTSMQEVLILVRIKVMTTS